jgi:hypothetical protein
MYPMRAFAVGIQGGLLAIRYPFPRCSNRRSGGPVQQISRTLVQLLDPRMMQCRS